MQLRALELVPPARKMSIPKMRVVFCGYNSDRESFLGYILVLSQSLATMLVSLCFDAVRWISEKVSILTQTSRMVTEEHACSLVRRNVNLINFKVCPQQNLQRP